MKDKRTEYSPLHGEYLGCCLIFGPLLNIWWKLIKCQLFRRRTSNFQLHQLAPPPRNHKSSPPHITYYQPQQFRHWVNTAQGALWAVRWPCSILAIAVKTLSHGKTIFFRLFSCVLLGRKLENLYRFSFSGTSNIIFGTLKIGHNDPEIPNLEFKYYGFLENKVFLATEQAGTNI